MRQLQTKKGFGTADARASKARGRVFFFLVFFFPNGFFQQPRTPVFNKKLVLLQLFL